MMQGLYISATGLKTHGEGMKIVSQNIANVSTVGYKQQLMLFQDLMYQEVPTGVPINVPQSKKGLGVAMNHVRTLHSKDGAFEPGNAMTDLAITGKGFFQVVDDTSGEAFYTRAGNFRFQQDGVLRNPQGFSVSGLRLNEDGSPGTALEQVKINFNDEAIATDPPKATTSMDISLNVNPTGDNSADEANPYFSLLGAWDATAASPLSQPGQSVPLSFYDQNGVKRELTMYFDQVSLDNGQKTIEYLVTLPPELDARANAEDSAGAGLLMAGTMTFSASGQLLNLSAFTPGSGDLKDLGNWTPAQLEDGRPQLSLTLEGQPDQTIGLNLGATGAAWRSSPASAAEVLDQLQNLPGLNQPVFNSQSSTSLPKNTALAGFTQNGHALGDLYDLYVDSDGMITAEYSNGQSRNLFQIPLCRFTSEDGLRHEGNNLYSATPDSGNMSSGIAGTENYGQIQGNTLETSNVDVAKEMVDMIMVQRGFQSNSKAITTWDTMIQKALELKR